MGFTMTLAWGGMAFLDAKSGKEDVDASERLASAKG